MVSKPYIFFLNFEGEFIMNQNHFFGNAKWVGAVNRTNKTFSVLRGHFSTNDASKAILNVLGLGFFKCYINGICINPDTFLPLSSDYEASCDPTNEILSGHRIYTPCFDISSYVRSGDNVIAIHYGGGWYTKPDRTFGLPKVIYSVTVTENDTVRIFGSDETCRIGHSFINEYDFVCNESHCYTGFSDVFGMDFDESTWENAVLTEPLDTEYCQTDCPNDALIETLTPQKIGTTERGTVYDCGLNTTGYPVLKIHAKAGDTVRTIFSEAILPSGEPDPEHNHRQQFVVVSDGEDRTVQPEFTWFGFRYFEVIGDAEPIEVKVVHANVPVSSSFHCDDETLNWIYKTFVHTMLCNMHTGHPSDCPHLERRGYTGDGQLTCHAALTVLDGKAFYEKWMQDISDCQDTLSGHVQYTAPYIHSGGGPGGWGCAIVEVPYQLYRHYGEKQVLAKYYPQMRKYIDYLEAHSEFGLVTSDKDGDWCLGDWCSPVVLYPDKDILFDCQQIFIPAPMVNTYFMVKSLHRMCEIAHIIGKDEDIDEYLRKAEQRTRAIKAAYCSKHDENYIMGVHGANAFAIDAGAATDRTYRNTVEYYKKLGHYDTGIFATDVLTRILFEHGDGELAVELLTQNGEQGFEHWRQNGVTTFHEYWDSNRSRSFNHQMFGAPVAYFFEYLLGIRQCPHTAGYSSLLIEPQVVSKFGHMSGSMKTPNGTVAVSYKKNESGICFTILIPDNTEAIFHYKDWEFTLKEGKNTFEYL